MAWILECCKVDEPRPRHLLPVEPEKKGDGKRPIATPTSILTVFDKAIEMRWVEERIYHGHHCSAEGK